MPSTYSPEKTDMVLHGLRTYGGNVARACRLAGIAQKTYYNWRERYPEFAEACEEAKVEGVEMMEAEVFRRGIEGYDEELHHQGVKTGDTVRRYSDTLAIFLLKAHKPEKYREHINHNVNINVDSELVDRLARGRAATALVEPTVIEGEIDDGTDLLD
jgi:hypothetical protein